MLKFNKFLVISFVTTSLLLPSISFAQAVADDDTTAVNACVDIPVRLSYQSKDNGITNYVSLLQEFLHDEGFLRSNATGFYGSNTVSAVRRFQLANNITQTGALGPMTRAKIKETTCAVPTPGLSCANLYWFDNLQSTCGGQKQFCGAYMYQGLQTFSSQSQCQDALGARPQINLVRVVTPNGNMSVNSGSNINVTWVSSNIPASQVLDLIRLRSLQTNQEYNLVTNVINDGQETVLIPTTLPAGVYALEIKSEVNAFVVKGVSDNAFSISNQTIATTSTTSTLTAPEYLIGGVGGSNSHYIYATEKTNFAWRDVPGATSFKMKINNSVGNPMTGLSAAMNAQDLGITSYGTYTTSVQACNSAGSCGPWSNQQTLIYSAPVLSAPAIIINKDNSLAPLNSNGSISTNQTLKFQPVFIGTNATQYYLTVNGQEKGPFTGEQVYSNLTNAGFVPGIYTITVKGCSPTLGCTSYSNVGSFTVTAAVVSSVPTVTLSEFSPSTIQVGQTSTISFTSTNATSCTGSGIWNGDLGGTHTPAGGATTPVMTTVGQRTQTVTCTGVGGSATSVTRTLVVTGGVSMNSFNTSRVLGVSTMCIDLPTNMHRGAESNDVKNLQLFLIAKGLLTESVTGFYGDSTVSAVRDYQLSKDLPVTGMVYDFTRQMIRADSCK